MKAIRMFALLLVVTGVVTFAAKLPGSENVNATARTKMPAYPRESRTDLKNATSLLEALGVKPKMPAYPRESKDDQEKASNLIERANVNPKMPAYPRASNKDKASNPLEALQVPFLFSPSQGGAGNDGTADLNPLNRSGIRALISVQKIGKTETVTGFATGMDPYKAYVSLFYDAGSPGSGPCACLPSNPPPAALAATCKTTDAPPVNFSQMVIGYWLPLIGSSTRTLQILKAGAPDAPGGAAFVELEKIGAVSVREDTQLGTPLPAAPDPGRFQLRACGKFKQNK